MSQVSKISAYGMCRKCYLEKHVRTERHTIDYALNATFSARYTQMGSAGNVIVKTLKSRHTRNLWASRRHRPCITCHVKSEIYAFDMCRKCYRKTPQVKEQENRYNVEYLARPTTGPARTNRRGEPSGPDVINRSQKSRQDTGLGVDIITSGMSGIKHTRRKEPVNVLAVEK